jgi:hypothetical protein
VVDLTGGEAARDNALELRRAGLRVDRAFDDRSMRAQMKAADRSGARVALIVALVRPGAPGKVAKMRAAGTDEQSRRCRWWALAPIAAPVLVFLEALGGRRLVAPGDGHTYYLPLHVAVADQWRAGVFPGWDHGAFAGSPLFGIHQSAALSPSTLLHLLLPPVSAHNLAVVAALAVAGTGAHLLALRLTGDALAAAVGGCAFALCGFQFAHLGHLAVIATAAWLPWCLWAADRLRERWSAARVATGAVVVALAALSGHGQMLAYTAAVTLAFTVLSVPWRRMLRAVARVAAMLAAGAALAAVQLLPVMEVLRGSDRTALGHAQATSFSQDPGGLLVLVFPFLYGNARAEGPVPAPYAGEWTLTELGGYVGVAALVLAAAGLPAVRRDRRLLALLLVAAGSVLVALGDSTPLSRVVHALPLFGQMRSWARYTLGAQLLVAVLAAVGVARVRRGESSSRPTWIAAAAVTVAAGLAAAGPWVADRRVEGGDLAWVVGASVVTVLVAAVGLGIVHRRPVAAVALVALVSVDAVVGFGWWFRWRPASPDPDRAVALVEGRDAAPWEPVPDAPGGIDRYLWADDPLAASPHTPRMSAASGMRSVTGMDPLAPADYLDATGTDYWGRLVEPSHLLGERSHLPDLLRVTVVADSGDGGPRAHRVVRSPTLPEAFLVGRARAAPRADAVAAAIGEADLDPGREAVIDQRCRACPWEGAPGRSGRAGAVRWGPSSASVVVTADRPSLLVVSQAWAPGWTATVDGRSVPVVRADGVVQAIPVPEGRSTVTLRYETPGLVLGGWISGLTAVLLVGGVVVGHRRQRQLSNQSRASNDDLESSRPVQIG